MENKSLGAENSNKFHGPSWDISEEYESLQSPKLSTDEKSAEETLVKVKALAERFVALLPRAKDVTLDEAKPLIPVAREATVLTEAATKVFWDLETFASCNLSVDSGNVTGKAIYGRAKVAQSRMIEAYNPVALFLKLCSDEIFEEFLKDPSVAADRFAIAQERKERATTLSLLEENLIIALGNNGPSAFGSLYNNVSGSMSLNVHLPDGVQKKGLAEAASLLQNEKEAVRQAAYEGINAGWKQNEEAAAAVLNGLAGWRHEVYQRRSYQKKVHYLDNPLHISRIERATLDAMMTAVGEAKGEAQHAVRLKAKALKKDKLQPWDFFAPVPQFEKTGENRSTFSDAISLVAESYSQVDPAMGDFVHMMADKHWIEGTVGPKKRPGGYCTWFTRSRAPRIYMTYAGGTTEVMTLAHELGHAFHTWVMRDLPFSEVHYPMTLAETASIFGETIVNNLVLSRAKSPQEKLAIAWMKARDAEAFLLNIPVRFSFETSFYDRRVEKALTPGELSGLMQDAWKQWYGDTLHSYDDMYWASKLHFSIAEVSFYNFPYTFGYLFALGVFAQRERLGKDFYQAYVNLLRDTGRMTAEEVAAKHLNVDLTKPDFWRQSIKTSLNGVDQLADALKAFDIH